MNISSYTSREGGGIRIPYHGSGRYQPVSEGNMFLLFPGEWHNYMPNRETGWDEYWIGFQGSHIDYWTANGFFSREKPIYNVGIHNEIVQLYQQAIRVAIEQKSGFQQVLSGIVNYLLGLAYSYDKNYVFETSEIIDQIGRAKILIAAQFKTIRPKQIAGQTEHELFELPENFQGVHRIRPGTVHSRDEANQSQRTAYEQFHAHQGDRLSDGIRKSRILLHGFQKEKRSDARRLPAFNPRKRHRARIIPCDRRAIHIKREVPVFGTSRFYCYCP